MFCLPCFFDLCVQAAEDDNDYSDMPALVEDSEIEEDDEETANDSDNDCSADCSTTTGTSSLAGVGAAWHSCSVFVVRAGACRCIVELQRRGFGVDLTWVCLHRRSVIFQRLMVPVGDTTTVGTW